MKLNTFGLGSKAKIAEKKNGFIYIYFILPEPSKLGGFQSIFPALVNDAFIYTILVFFIYLKPFL